MANETATNEKTYLQGSEYITIKFNKSGSSSDITLNLNTDSLIAMLVKPVENADSNTLISYGTADPTSTTPGKIYIKLES